MDIDYYSKDLKRYENIVYQKVGRKYSLSVDNFRIGPDKCPVLFFIRMTLMFDGHTYSELVKKLKKNNREWRMFMVYRHELNTAWNQYSKEACPPCSQYDKDNMELLSILKELTEIINIEVNGSSYDPYYDY